MRAERKDQTTPSRGDRVFGCPWPRENTTKETNRLPCKFDLSTGSSMDGVRLALRPAAPARRVACRCTSQRIPP